MWKCIYCETENYDQSLVCSCCCKKKTEASPPDSTPPKPTPSKPTSPKKRSKLLVISICIALLLALGFFTIHDWEPATCTEAEICKICGKIGQPAPGHKATTATCLKQSKCTVCQAELSSPLGHKWIPATYSSPKTCSRCNIQEGHVKGYIGDLSGQQGDSKVSLRGTSRSVPYWLNAPLENCISLSMLITINSYNYFPFGKWYLYARDLNGNWNHIAEFDLDESALSGSTYTFKFDPAKSFDALAITKQQTGDAYSMNRSISFYDVQVLEN